MKLPTLYRNNNIVSNNRNTFVNYEKINGKEENKILEINYYELFNKNIEITLNKGNVERGILLSKNNNYLLLSTGNKYNIDEIKEIKKIA